LDELAPLFSGDVAGSLRRAVDAIEDRWRPDRLTNHDGVLTDPRAIELVWNRMSPDATPWSPTRLEALSNCPFAFFVEHALRLRPHREPGDDYDPMERGEIFHALLETIYRALHEHDALPLEPSQLPDAFRLLDELVAHIATPAREAAARVQRAASLAGIRNDAAIVLARDAHRPPIGSSRPAYFELAFGMGDAPAPAIDLGDVRLPLRGKADRVDLVDGDRFDVVDYKTGRVRAKSHRLTSADEGKITVHLQAPLYLVALAGLLSKSPRSATLYPATADQAFEEVRFDAADLERLRPRLIELLVDSLDHARRGWFPCTPGHTCCRRDLRLACGPSVAARFRRKAGVDALVDHQARLDRLDAEAGA
jgi:RecB family exonuclease